MALHTSTKRHSSVFANFENFEKVSKVTELVRKKPHTELENRVTTSGSGATKCLWPGEISVEISLCACHVLSLR